MLYFSSLLKRPPYRAFAARLFAALERARVPYILLDGTKDVWLRDFMPVKTADGRYVSFRYEPSYLRGYAHLRTVYADLPHKPPVDVRYADLRLDGGNVVLSPSKTKAVVSDRVFSENPGIGRDALIGELTAMLAAKVIVIPGARGDVTGHADGMVRFANEDTVLCNTAPSPRGPERRIKSIMASQGLKTVDFPYYETADSGVDGMNSAEGCYLNYLETEKAVFLPQFGHKTDRDAVSLARQTLQKPIVGVDCRKLAPYGGLLNCISWET